MNLEKKDRIALAANTERKILLFSRQIEKKSSNLGITKRHEDKIFPP